MARRKIILTSEDEDLLNNHQLSVSFIVEKLKISAATVNRWRRKNGIPKHKSGRKLGKKLPHLHLPRIEFHCLHCGNTCFRTEKNSQAKFCSLSCLHSSDWLKLTASNFDRSYTKTEAFSKAQSKITTPEFKRYSGKIHRLTKKVYEEFKSEINPQNHPRGVCGSDGVYQLDHIISIKQGFLKNIPIEQIACKENLQMLPWKENLLKGSR